MEEYVIKIIEMLKQMTPEKIRVVYYFIKHL